jgi:hypothetical protein
VEPSYVSVLRALCRSITHNEAIRVKGKQEGYRCKATYSLLPKLQVSPLSMDRVNEIAAAVNDFCMTQSKIVSVAPDFFYEVCVKVSRDGRYMVKLSLLNQQLHHCHPTSTSPAMLQEATHLDVDVVASVLAVPAVPARRSENGVETLFDVWLRCSEPHALEDYLRAKNPNLVALVAHVRMPLLQQPGNVVDPKDVLHCKPDKTSAYVPLTRDGAAAMVEYTPNGHTFWLSPDSFCEVNHAMEMAIYEAIVEFLRLSPSRGSHGGGMCGALGGDVPAVFSGEAPMCPSTPTEETVPDGILKDVKVSSTLHPKVWATPSVHMPSPSSSSRRRVFICGRDVNSVVRTFEEYYSATTVVTTCPCVYADTAMNEIVDCIYCGKDQIADPLRRFASLASPSSSSLAGDACAEECGCSPAQDLDVAPPSTSTSPSAEAHCLITAGRHGLHPKTTIALAELGAAGQLSDLVYVSCNVESLTRDVHVLKEAWYIAHARTFDFFPGTEYVMTVLHLRPLSSCVADGGPGGGDLLVLPVGSPGTGKSTSGRALEAFFNAACGRGREGETSHPFSNACARPLQCLHKKRKTKHDSSVDFPSCFVPRTFITLPPSALTFRHVERDRIFHEHKACSSLKAAKQKTHEAMVNALGAWESSSSAPTGSAPAFSSSFPLHQRRVLYLDSTNGSDEARQIYQSLWCASSHLGRSAGSCRRDGVGGDNWGSADLPLPASCVVLFFDAPGDTAELLRRVRQRGVHPSFPSSAEEQQRKLFVIAEVLDGSGPEGKGCDTADGLQVRNAENSCCTTPTFEIRASAKDDAAAETVQEVVLTVCLHLLFSRHLASLLREDALELLRENP